MLGKKTKWRERERERSDSCFTRLDSYYIEHNLFLPDGPIEVKKKKKIDK
jgi:hypothetical protein